METALKKDAISRRIKFIALFSRLWFIMIGGLFAAIGVLGMHYLGMQAQRTNAIFSFDVGIVALSSVVAFVTANAAFWILFRAVSLHIESCGVTIEQFLTSSLPGTSSSPSGPSSRPFGSSVR